MMDTIFNPFESRLCRDIRNKLAHGFIKSIQAGDIMAFLSAKKSYGTESLSPSLNNYILHRTTCMEKVLDEIKAGHLKSYDTIKIALLLWNLELFFEFHEWLEEKWLNTRGNNKKALQALILAAVVYELLEYGRQIPAQKVASKAILLFKTYRNSIHDAFDTEGLILKLTDLDPDPPKFNLP